MGGTPYGSPAIATLDFLKMFDKPTLISFESPPLPSRGDMLVGITGTNFGLEGDIEVLRGMSHTTHEFW